MGAVLLTLSDVERDFEAGGAAGRALSGVSLTVYEGEMLALLGPSGAGKTALLGVLGALDLPTRGAYRFRGADVAAMSERERAQLRNRRIGQVFDVAHLAEHLTAQRNVEVPLEYGGGKRYKVRARDRLAYAGLAGRESARPSALTPGERQRVAIARAAVMNPHLLLADEPTASLDAHAALQALALLQRLHADGGLTLIVATAQPSVAAYCTRVVRLAEGRVGADEAVGERRSAALELHRAEREGAA